ncbi:MAG: glycosyltransferase family 1 protein [Candidatus Moranbacteria bacterium]|jgi:glycosyltransferase involved in cell wall biosynthesis|nr:glycosyltransferase family 1 protein [Candidatus Moranbacteria bacterium]MDD5652423.1 glycosyltransferase family 1 protein [Candidatus Moranbacteria bacterium]MDX9855814.1 glycosyltransferase family 1 protein [Candidatus Moranbacteria bacterium]
MRIGIDVRCLYEGRQTGVEEYAVNLLKNIFKEDKRNRYVLFFNAFKKSKADFGWIKDYSNVELKTFRYPNKLLNFLFWYLKYPKADRMLGGVDYFFMPNINFIALSRKAKLILTIHDLSFKHFPETFPFKTRLWHWFVNPKTLARNAQKIIAVSRSTKEDLERIYKIPEEKIEVIYNGISEKLGVIDRNNPRLLEVKEKYDLPFNFILFLGTFEPRKNIIGAVRAYEILRRRGGKDMERFKLVIAGARGWKSRKIKKDIGRSEFREDILLLNFIEEDDKTYLYNLASLFVYPSFFEGFGIPPLEAMKCGINVVASNNSSMPEVVGGGGILVDADRPDEIAIAMRELILDKKAKEEISRERMRQVQKFSWGRSAREFIRMLESF